MATSSSRGTYNLNSKTDAFEYNNVNVTEFGKNLRTEIPEIRRAMTNGGKFTMAVPIGIAASCHQYEHYVPIHGDGCGPACQAYGSGC